MTMAIDFERMSRQDRIECIDLCRWALAGARSDGGS
jgi:hypothetical protein